MNSLRTLLTRQLTSSDDDATMSAIASYLTAFLILVCGFVTVGLLSDEMAQTFLAILGVLSLSMLFVILGQLIEIHQRLKILSNTRP